MDEKLLLLLRRTASCLIVVWCVLLPLVVTAVHIEFNSGYDRDYDYDVAMKESQWTPAVFPKVCSFIAVVQDAIHKHGDVELQQQQRHR